MAGPAPGGRPGVLGSLGDRRDLIVPIAVIGVLALMVLPLPPIALDLLLAISITLSLIVLLTSVHIVRPLEFSVFPSVLLVLTLFRLSLNVASTRLILLNGAEGGGAGAIIQSFGSFVVGGNTVVGIVVFLILVLINFAVITKGSGRIAEVAARFTLDAMPGKQMSIDADLAAGIIDQEEAKRRRSEVGREADFYGAMDGASKFVRGDAVAGLIITAINIVGGLVVGVAQKGQTFGDAAGTYTILTVGDGLVSQIPALLISTAAGIIITRAAGSSRLGTEVSGQLLSQPSVLLLTASLLGAMSFIPGLPIVAFAPLGGLLVWLARRAARTATAALAGKGGDARVPGALPEKKEERITDLLPVETLQLEVGLQLVGLVDTSRGGQLLERIASIRKMMAKELGVVVPPMHVRDNLDLAPNEYRLLLRDSTIGRGLVEPGRLMAMDPGGGAEPLEGVRTKDPAFGLDAVWIEQSQKLRAERAGYAVVDATSVIATHLTELLRSNAADLLGRQELQELLDVVAERAPKVVEDLLPKLLDTGAVLQVLRRLLDENVSIRDLRTILETLADHAPNTRNVFQLTELVRRRLANQLSASVTTENGKIFAAMADRELQDALRASLVESDGRPQLAMDLSMAEALMSQVRSLVDRFTLEDRPAVLVVPSELRGPLRELLARFFPELHVLSHHEISGHVTLQATTTLSAAGLPPARGSSRGTRLTAGTAGAQA